MSAKLIALVFERARATGVDLLVLVALAHFCNAKRGDNIAWPSLAVLAKRVRLTISGLCKSLKRLEALGDIERDRSNGGRNRRSRYIICVGNSEPLDTVSTVENYEPEDSVSGQDLNSETVSHRKPCPSGNGVRTGNETVSVRSHAINKNRTRKRESAESDKQIPDSLSHKRSRKLTAPNPAALEVFECFYQAYPRRVAKKKAFEAWLELNPDAETVSVIMGAVERYAEEVRNTELRFIPHPATWLNDRRWEDEPERNSGNGRAKPPEVKDLGNGIVEVGGLKMTRETYERKYARQGN